MSRVKRELPKCAPHTLLGKQADNPDHSHKRMVQPRRSSENLGETLARLGEAMERDYIKEMIGQLVGGYRILSHLGTGGMSTVFLAECVANQTKAAVKILRGACSGVLLHRFLREQEILATLHHSGIANLLDGGLADDGSPYAVMEYVNGEPIDLYCRKNQLNLVDRLVLFIRVCEAVEHAHQEQVVHRDLKPGNILVTADGTPKILDFGIAKTLNFESWPGLTDPGRSPMTPGYASPEQFRGSSVASTSDTYSLGMLLYELLTGHHPFLRPGSPTLDMERAALEFDPQKPSSLVKDIGAGFGLSDAPNLVHQLAGDLDNIVLKATEREPERRYSSVQALSDDLHCFLKGKSISARGTVFGRRIRSLLSRYGRTARNVAAVGLLSTGIATGVFLDDLQAPTDLYAQAKATKLLRAKPEDIIWESLMSSRAYEGITRFAL